MDKRQWINDIANEAGNAAHQPHMKTLYSLTKVTVLSNERPRQSTAVKDKNGNILNVKERKTKNWYELFNEVLNIENPSNPVSIAEIEPPDETEEVDESVPNRAEIKEAIKHLRNGKASGIDNIEAVDIDFVTIKVKEIINIVWREERIPGKWRRRITLLPVVSKLMGETVIEKIRSGVDSKLRKEQAGFRNIIKQSIEWQSTLCVHFMDFEKAFDSVHRGSLWLIMQSYGIPSKMISMVKALYNDFE